MKINSIGSFNNVNFKLYKNKKDINKNTSFNSNLANIPSKNYLSFLGVGISSNLKEVHKALKTEEYPVDILQAVQKELNNPTGKNLAELHFDKYDGINNCFSLSDLKAKYPEFSNVISISDADFYGGFLEDYDKDKLKLFSKDEDLTLQLIKLYWGNGFSLKDLSYYISTEENYPKGFNIRHIMADKLNIPLMNSHYAALLKLTNKHYDSAIQTRLKEQLEDAKEARKQREEGEPVVIPQKRILTQEHKEHISQGLKKYYQEHPERIYLMSERQKAFYEKNPKEKRLMQLVATYAWNSTIEGRKLKKNMSKFFKKHNITDEELTFKKELSKEKKDALSDFWKKNPWASAQWSEAMTKSWEYNKVDLKEFFSKRYVPGERLLYKAYPHIIADDIKDFVALHTDLNPDEMYLFDYSLEYKGQPPRKVQDYLNNAIRAVNKYYEKHPGVGDLEANTLAFALVELKKEFFEDDSTLPENVKSQDLKVEVLKSLFENLEQKKSISYIAQNQMIPVPNLTSRELSEFLSRLMQMALTLEFPEFAEHIDDLIELGYDKAARIDAINGRFI